jgi:hypothetical protein
MADDTPTASNRVTKNNDLSESDLSKSTVSINIGHILMPELPDKIMKEFVIKSHR